MTYFCRRCGERVSQLPRGMGCRCGASLWMDYPHSLSRGDIRAGLFSMWRYMAALPVPQGHPLVTLGEGLSPLVPATWDGYPIQIKNESQLPTGSFKDRGIAMVINCLKAQGVICISEDSSGNAGASTAAYSAKAGIHCDVYVPEHTSEGKTAQIAAFGAALHRIPGDREHAARSALEGCGDSVYAGHNWHPAFVEGVKTVAYEIWEQNGFSVPDAVICAVGNGSMAIGLYLGFCDLLAGGEIQRLPRIYGVQSANCDTMVRLYHGEAANNTPLPTVAEGIALHRSTKGPETVAMVRESGGTMLRVTEEEILSALRKLIRQGFFPEPTSAAAFAGLSQLLCQGELRKGGKTVVILSGNGLKASRKIFSLLEKGPPRREEGYV